MIKQLLPKVSLRLGLYEARKPGENAIVIGVGFPKHNSVYSYSTPVNDPDLDPLLVFSPKETLLQLVSDFLSVIFTGAAIALLLLVGYYLFNN